MYNYCLNKYLKREVTASIFCENDTFYYWTKTEEFRRCINKKEIWVNLEFPYIRRIR